MKTPTRILVGGPEVTSAFVLMGLALARRAMMRGGGCRIAAIALRRKPRLRARRMRSEGWVTAR